MFLSPEPPSPSPSSRQQQKPPPPLIARTRKHARTRMPLRPAPSVGVHRSSFSVPTTTRTTRANLTDHAFRPRHAAPAPLHLISLHLTPNSTTPAPVRYVNRAPAGCRRRFLYCTPVPSFTPSYSRSQWPCGPCPPVPSFTPS